MSSPLTVQALLREGEAYLQAREIESSRLDAELLLAHVRGSTRLQLFTSADSLVASPDEDRFRELLRERGTHRPLAQIVGYRDFYNARFRVSPDVLIPRPESEEIVEAALRELPSEQGTARILDLCCGTGCIGLSILLERPGLKLDLSDISDAALEVARENARTLFPESRDGIRFFSGDLFAALPEVESPYQGIVCNPPYIHPDEAGTLAADVRDFEPSMALFHEDPSGLYDSILTQARSYLRADGFLFLELAPRWAAGALERARELYLEAEIRADLGGLERFLLVKGPKMSAGG